VSITGSPRRLVTGQRPDGTSVISRVEDAERLDIPGDDGREVWRVWGADSLPVQLPTDGIWPPGAEPSEHGMTAFLSRLPPPAGVRCTIVRYQPGWADPLYAIDTADVVFILDGELVYCLDGGEETVVRHGDVVVQNGVKKSWQNRSDRPAMIAALVLGAVRSEEAGTES
jgi:quercetin dioxygenase-like cupin family protein